MTQVATQPVVKLTPDDLARVNPAYWATRLVPIVLPEGCYTFAEGRDYQRELLENPTRHRRRAVKKGTQGGITQVMILYMTHGLIHGRYRRGGLYLFPTEDDVGDFGKTRWNPLILANPITIGKYVKTGGKGVNTTYVKNVGASHLYLRGARLSQSMDSGMDERQSVKLANIPVDCVFFDEADFMDEKVFAKARERMGDSRVKEEFYAGNPSIPGLGIDRIFNEGDQRYWHRRCGCGQWVSADLTFPDCVKVGKDGRGFIGCSKCGSDVGPLSGRKGEWIPKVPSLSSNLLSYHVSHLMSARNDPKDILNAVNDPPENNLSDVLRLKLGNAHVAETDCLRTPVIYECCSCDPMAMRHSGPCAMGVDRAGTVKNFLHVVIGCRTGKDRYVIVRVARVNTLNEVHDLSRQYNVRSEVLDLNPNPDDSRSYQKTEGGRKIRLAVYLENSALDVDYSDSTGLVKANRTEIFDRTHKFFSQKMVTLPRRCAEVEEFAEQCCNTAKILETNKRTGGGVYRYIKKGAEHYRNALNYFAMAADSTQIAKVSNGTDPNVEEYAIANQQEWAE